MQQNVTMRVCVSTLFSLNICDMILPVPRKKGIGQLGEFTAHVVKNPLDVLGWVGLVGGEVEPE